MLTPEQLAKSNSEHAHQTALFCWAALPETREHFPGIELMFAIPNGGERNKIVAAKMKAEGVKAGVLDIFLPLPKGNFHGMFLEMKKHPNKPTEEQHKFAIAVQNKGYYCAVAYSWLQACDIIANYFNCEMEHLE